MISLVAAPAQIKAARMPAALDATDAELVRLAKTTEYRADRARWEATAALLGGFRPQ